MKNLLKFADSFVLFAAIAGCALRMWCTVMAWKAAGMYSANR